MKRYYAITLYLWNDNEVKNMGVEADSVFEAIEITCKDNCIDKSEIKDIMTDYLCDR